MLPGKKFTPELILQILWRRCWLLVVPLFLGGLAGLLYSRSIPDMYRSDALIQVVPQRVPDSYVQSTVTERVEDRLKSLSQQVMSRTQLERIIEEFDLYPELRRARPMEDVVETMNSNVEIEPVRNRLATRGSPTVESFHVRFVSTDARTAQRVVERISRIIIDENARDRGSLAEATNQFLDGQLADARARLEEQERRLKEFRERNSGRLPTQTQTNLQAIQSLQMQLQSLVESTARDRDRRMILERLLADASADLAAFGQSPPMAAAPVGAGDSASVAANATPQQRLEAARAALAQLELKLKPQHPDVQRMKRVIRDLEAQVAVEETQQPLTPGQPPARAVSSDELARRERVREMRAEIESLDRQVEFKESEGRRIRGLIADYQGKLEAVPGVESAWIALTRDYDTLQETYKNLLQKSENSKVAANLEQRQIGEQFRIVDPARVPERPFSPNRLQITGVAFSLSLAVGLGLIALLEFFDTTMKSETDVLGALALPVLAVVPLVATAVDRTRERRWKLGMAAAGAVSIVASGALVWWLELWRYAM